MFVDSHCHLDFPELASDLPAVLDAMRAARVSHALCISVDLERWPAVHAIACAHPHLHATVGVHPDADKPDEPTVERLVELARQPKVVAIGETGLDYYRLEGDPAPQRERFRVHIAAAREAGKPLVVHTRSAGDDTLAALRKGGADRVGGVMHCFTESWPFAQAALELGFYISFSGIVTFKNAVALKDVARRVPLERMLIETDSPYLAPVPFRGQRNHPALVVHVAAEIARLRDEPIDTIAAVTSDNFFRLFGIERS